MVLYAANDLLWATRIKRTGEDLGVRCRPVRDGAMLDARLGEGGVRALIVDLDMGAEGIALIERARARSGDLPIVCFGPHVREDLFELAGRAGADRTLARGAFDRRLGEILLGLGGPAEGEPGGPA